MAVLGIFAISVVKKPTSNLLKTSMGKITKHLPVKLICGITYRSTINLNKVIAKLESMFSTVDTSSEHFDFSAFTSYYEAEMGKSLKKFLFQI